MRYYRIEIPSKIHRFEVTGEGGKYIQLTPSENLFFVCSSHLDNGQMDRGALNVVFNITLSYLHESSLGASFVEIQGVPLSLLNQANNLMGKYVRILGGMTKGYVVEKDTYGVLLEGIITEPYGNWAGTNQSLSFFLGPTRVVMNPDITVSWKKGQKLSDAIRLALANQFKNAKIEMDITNDQQCLLDQGAVYHGLINFANAINMMQRTGKNDKPIVIYESGGTIYVTDNTDDRFGKRIQLKAADLIGQPVWSDNSNITVELLMRSDIYVNDIINFPKEAHYFGLIKPADHGSPFNFNRGINANQKNNVIFQGDFLVTSIQHIGNYKSPASNEWITFLTLASLENAIVNTNIPKVNGLP